MAIDRAGNILVTDHSNQRVQAFKPDGSFINACVLGANLVGICVAPDGSVLVGESGRVRAFAWSVKETTSAASTDDSVIKS